MVSHHPIGSDTTHGARPALLPRPRHAISHLRNGHRYRCSRTTVDTFGDTPPACPLDEGVAGCTAEHGGSDYSFMRGLPAAVDQTPCPITSVPTRPKQGKGGLYKLSTNRPSSTTRRSAA